MVWTWESIIQNIFFGIVMPILLYYGLPRIDLYIKNRSLTSRKRRIEELKEDYRLRKILNVNSLILTPYAFKDFMGNLRRVILGLTWIVVYYIVILNFFASPKAFTTPEGRVAYGVGFVLNCAYIVYSNISPTYHILNDSWYFSKYKIEAEKKMKKLGGNPEDLDKTE